MEFMTDPDKDIFRQISEDKIDLDTPGFYWRSHYRSAYIYFVENESVIPFYCELPGVNYLDVLIFGETEFIEKRYYPGGEKVELLPFEERLRIQGLLVKWLSEKGCRHDIKAGQ